MQRNLEENKERDLTREVVQRETNDAEESKRDMHEGEAARSESGNNGMNSNVLVRWTGEEHKRTTNPAHVAQAGDSIPSSRERELTRAEEIVHFTQEMRAGAEMTLSNAMKQVKEAQSSRELAESRSMEAERQRQEIEKRLADALVKIQDAERERQECEIQRSQHDSKLLETERMLTRTLKKCYEAEQKSSLAEMYLREAEKKQSDAERAKLNIERRMQLERPQRCNQILKYLKATWLPTSLFKICSVIGGNALHYWEKLTSRLEDFFREEPALQRARLIREDHSYRIHSFKLRVERFSTGRRADVYLLESLAMFELLTFYNHLPELVVPEYMKALHNQKVAGSSYTPFKIGGVATDPRNLRQGQRLILKLMVEIKEIKVAQQMTHTYQQVTHSDDDLFQPFIEPKIPNRLTKRGSLMKVKRLSKMPNI